MTSVFRYVLACVALSMIAAVPGHADFITWEIYEVYSNADGTVQFVEFVESNGQNGQRSFTGKALKTFITGASWNDPLNTHIFSSDLPSNFTANKYALVATQDFASLPGAVQPDFVMPDGFIDTSVVVEIELGTIDEFMFAQGAIPTDGVNSLNRVGTPVDTNSPTNFVGDTGSIDLPEPAAAAQAGAALACLLALRYCGSRPRAGRR